MPSTAHDGIPPSGSSQPSTRPRVTSAPARQVAGALTRYRVMANVVGVMLLVLVFVAMPVKYLGHSDTMVAIVGPVHGFLYVVYLLSVLDLATRTRMNLRRMLAVMLAGTIPFLSFVAEHYLTRRYRAEPAR